jgi:hypothetical protein
LEEANMQADRPLIVIERKIQMSDKEKKHEQEEEQPTAPVVKDEPTPEAGDPEGGGSVTGDPEGGGENG